MTCRPVVLLTAAFVTGLLAAERINWSAGKWAIVAAGLTGLTLAAARARRSKLAAAATLSAVAAAAAAWLQARQTPVRSVADFCSDGDSIVCLRGVIKEPPAPRRGPLRPLARAADFKWKPMGWAYVMQVEAIRCAGRWAPTRGRVRATIGPRQEPGSRLALNEGDQIEQVGALRPLRPPRNPAAFDYARYARGRGVVASLHSSSPASVRKLSGSTAPPWSQLLARLRARVARALRDGLDDDAFGLAASMLLGYRRCLDPELAQTFRRTGTVHYLAISGLHAGLMAGMVWCVLHALRLPHAPRAAVVIGFLVLYGTLVGWRPSVTRAVAMISVYLAAPLAGRQRDQLSAVAAAALVVLIVNPLDLHNPGFQFSFAGVAGILLLTPAVERALFPNRERVARLHAPTEDALWGYWAARTVSRAAAVSLAAWLATAPLTARYYHLFNFWAPAINLAAGLVVWFILASGLLMLLTAGLAAPAALPAIGFAAAALIWMLRKCEAAPGCGTYVVGPSSGWIAAYYALLAAWGLRSPLRLPAKHGLFATLALAGAYVWFHARPTAPRHTRVTFFDVGHGLSALAEFPDGRRLLYDVGSSGGADVGAQIVAPYLWSQGATRLDAVVLSHADSDHCNGLEGLASRIRIGAVVVSEPTFRSPFGQRLSEWAERRGVPLQSASAGDALRVTSAARIRVVGPPAHGGLAERLSSNDRSLILMVESEGRRLLLTGDASACAWALARRNARSLRADVVQAPHHGRAFEGVRPFVAEHAGAILAASNARGSMKREVIDACRDYGVRLLQTAELGALRFALTPAGVRAEHYAGGAWRPVPLRVSAPTLSRSR